MKIVTFVVTVAILIQAIKTESIDDSPTKLFQQPAYSRALVESVQKIVDDLLANALDLLKNLTTEVTKILGTVLQVVTTLIQDAEKLLQQLADEVLEQIQQIADIHNTCVAGQEENVHNVIAAGREGVQNCVTNAYGAIKNIHNKTSAFEIEIGNEVANIQQIFQQCESSNPIEFVSCVIARVSEIRESLASIATSAKQLIGIATEEFNTVVDETKNCIVAITDNVRNELNAISKDIANCIESQNPN